MSDKVAQHTPEPTTGFAETHVSTVFFTADRAYKLLKPLRTSFLDHTTVEKRLAAVDAEIELNRRMSPDVYLGSADVTESGSLVDRMIIMRRLPADKRLPNLVGTELFEPALQQIARQVAVFHAAQTPVIDADGIAGRDAIRQNWFDNYAEIEPLVGRVLPADDVAQARDYLERYLDHRGSLFTSRLAGGYVRDGHGDLTAEDIFCLPDGPRILDCLAFDPRLRIADVIADVAFLAMDLHRLAGRQAAAKFMDWYCEYTTEQHPPSLADHYVAYRASVRAKVAAIRYGQGDAGAADMVRGYHDLCLEYLRRADPKLILVGGAPGTGKTTLANALSDATGFVALSSDELRKDLAGVERGDHRFHSADVGIYNPEMSERTYRELFARAGLLLDAGASVILDASWKRCSDRSTAAEMASATGARLIEIECVLDAHTAKVRVDHRLHAGDDSSDARPEFVDALRARHEPWPSAMPVDTSGPLEQTLSRTIQRIDGLDG